MKSVALVLVRTMDGGILAADQNSLLNVSYDVAREFYEDYAARNK